MSASWDMEGTTADNRQALLHFGHGRGRPRLEGRIHRVGKRHRFANQAEADVWGAELGVRLWRVTSHSRAFPEAAQIPIRFAEAPDERQLMELVARFAAGTPWNELVEGVMINVGGTKFQVPPSLLRLWLIGAAPNHPALQRIKSRVTTA
jgi:hypothetical protein